MDLTAIIARICDEADDFLANVTKRDEARTGIDEWLTINHPQISPTDRKAIITQSMAILDKEGFFEQSAGRDE